MRTLATIGVFVATALAEILGCYLGYLWLRKDAPVWILLPAALSLAVFVWLLALHPHAAGRVYAAYGGIYIAVALLWLWVIDGARPDHWDLLGITLSLAGMGVIYFGPRS